MKKIVRIDFLHLAGYYGLPLLAGMVLGDPASFHTVEEANKVLLKICNDQPVNECYDKIYFAVMFEDGYKYEGRYDAANPACKVFEEPDLKAHMREFAQYMLDNARKFGVEKAPKYEADAKNFLENYDV